MTLLLSAILPLFLLIALGWLAARFCLLSTEHRQGLSRFVLYLALPALLIRELSSRPPTLTLQADYFCAYLLGSLWAFGAAFYVMRCIAKQTGNIAALNSLGMSASNSAFIGYPLAASVMGNAAAPAMALGMLVEMLVMIPLTVLLCERENRNQTTPFAQQIAKRWLKNPLLWSMALGLALAGLEWHLPSPVQRSLDLLAQGAAPAALLVIGASLCGFRAHGEWNDLARIALGKLFLHPLAVALAFMLLAPQRTDLLTTAVLFASAPMMSLYPLVAHEYGQGSRCAAALTLTTALAFFSIPLVTGLLLSL